MSKTLHIKQGKLIGVQTSVFTIFDPEKYDAKAIPTAWREFFTKAAGTALTSTELFYGASIPSMSMDEPMQYFAGALMDPSFEVPAGFESVEIPEGKYFAFTHVGSISNIAASYQIAYGKELPESGNEMRPAPHLEIYNSQGDPMAADYEMIIGIPVQ